jgi:RNA-directed DNA polymerase
MHVPEESHSGVVPMNHSNKDGTSSAESEEGRLLIKENAFPSGTYPTQSGTARASRVGECADKLYAWPLLIRDKNRMR